MEEAISAPEAGGQKAREGCYLMDRQQEKHSGKGEQFMHTSETLHNILKTTRVGFDCLTDRTSGRHQGDLVKPLGTVCPLDPVQTDGL